MFVKSGAKVVGSPALTFVCSAGPETFQVNGVYPIVCLRQRKDWSIGPRGLRDSICFLFPPYQLDCVFRGVDFGIPRRNFNTVRIDCAHTRKDDVCGWVQKWVQEKLGGGEEQQCVDRKVCKANAS